MRNKTRKRRNRIISLGVLLTMLLGLAGCGNGGGTDTSYTMWLYSGTDSSYYSDYADNPVMQYLMSKEWGEDNKQVDFEFWIPASGTAADSYSTMMGSGDYPDILDCSIADPPQTLYQQDVIMDLTELIPEYMPNYMAYLEAHPEVKPYAISNVDGEEKYLSIYQVNEDYDYTYCGHMYRRDWLVKYGVNPSTNEPFSGGYNSDDVDDWSDNVMFPSWYDEDKKAKYLTINPQWDGTDPAYISDWEWMFGIFEKAYKDLGIDDSYCMSIYYTGSEGTGNLCSSFGGGNWWFYVNEDNEVVYGGTSDQARAYMECMNRWYDKGWLEQDFDQRTADMFYSIDDTSVRQGKVAMTCGLQAELGGRLDMDDEYTDGIFMQGCPLPVNDVYGTEDCKYIAPDCIMTGTGLQGTNYAITTAAEDKDIPTLLTFFDYLYSEEGALMKTCGLNEKQAKEAGVTFYQDHGVGSGMYTQGEDGRYAWVDAVKQDSGSLKGAGQLGKFPGLTLVSSIDAGYAPTYQHSMDEWILYKNQGMLNGSPITLNMDGDTLDELNNALNKLNDYLGRETVGFIKGEQDINSDRAWKSYVKDLQKYNYEDVIKLVQPYADMYPLR